MRELSYLVGSLVGDGGRNIILMQRVPPCHSSQSVWFGDQAASFPDLSRPVPSQLS